MMFPSNKINVKKYFKFTTDGLKIEKQLLNELREFETNDTLMKKTLQQIVLNLLAD